MSEIPRSPDTPDQPLAKVVNIEEWLRDDDELLDPYELEPAEAADFFIRELLHPSRQGSVKELAEYIDAMIGPFSKGELSERNQVWRGRLLGISVDGDILDDDQMRALIQADDVFSDIYRRLLETIDRATDMREERLALRWLMGLRASLVLNKETDNPSTRRWRQLIAKLSS